MLAYEAVIGLEVHAQLSTESKIFCSCSTRFGGEPNAQTCPVCLGMPGALPVLNRRAVEYAIRFGHAIGAEINVKSVFARKNYFYPDLPKGYQISQFESPIVRGGELAIQTNSRSRVIGVTRAHLEEDAGQSVHDGMPQSKTKSYVNLNRAGVPLLEIVSEPQIHSPDEAYAYLTELKSILQYLQICDGNMEEGSLRCDANISIRVQGARVLGTRTELKNLNSFNNVRKALQHEIDRQVAIVRSGGEIAQETLLWDAEAQRTRVMRGKEDSHDYRYFPDPDLLPIRLRSQWIAEIAAGLPELPAAKRTRFIRDFGLSDTDALILTSDRELARYFEQVNAVSGHPKLSANWIITELLRELKTLEPGIDDCPVTPQQFGRLVRLIRDKTISGKIGKRVFASMMQSGDEPEEIVEQLGLSQITDAAEIDTLVGEVLRANASQVEAFRAGTTKVFGFLVGQAMRASNGRANPETLNSSLRRQLEQSP